MKDFAAIDFETANGSRTSICSIGVVIVENGIITEKLYYKVRPIPNFYNRINTSIHGLSNKDTDNAMTFPEAWAEIAPKIRYLPFVAHNKAFDESCLKAVFKVYEMEYPDYIFFCTYIAARRILRGKLPNFQLHTVAAMCGCDMQNHHHALADAEACAAIALKIL